VTASCYERSAGELIATLSLFVSVWNSVTVKNEKIITFPLAGENMSNTFCCFGLPYVVFGVFFWISVGVLSFPVLLVGLHPHRFLVVWARCQTVGVIEYGAIVPLRCWRCDISIIGCHSRWYVTLDNRCFLWPPCDEWLSEWLNHVNCHDRSVNVSLHRCRNGHTAQFCPTWLISVPSLECFDGKINVHQNCRTEQKNFESLLSHTSLRCTNNFTVTITDEL